jgi:hypothetical protein
MRGGVKPAASPATVLPLESTPALWRGVALLASVAFALAWTVAQGNDVHWDAVNYHLYAGFAALNDRFAVDFFAAGPPSYLNPYAFVPLYLASAAEWSALATAAMLASWHALALWLVFEIAWTAGRGAPATRGGFAMLAMLLAAMNPVLLQVLGATTSDMSTAVLVLAAWLVIVVSLRDGASDSRMLVAGLIAGVAVALKLSNGVFALAALAALLLAPGALARRLRATALFGAACAAAFVAVSWPWAWTLWREFGNPLFPFFNHVFQSPDFTAEALRYERFIPSSFGAFLWRPFALLSAASHVHTEPNAPDLRYAALIVLVAVLALRHRLGRLVPEPGQSSERAAGQRAFLGILVGLAVAWIAWLAMSGNSRYFLPMACLAGVALALAMQRLREWTRDGALVVVALVVLLQGTQLIVGTDLEREGGPWEGPWLRVEVPQRLRESPALYLSAGFLSGSAFLPNLHPASGMINVGGFNIVAPGHPGWTKASALIERNASRVRLLLPMPAGVTSRATLPGRPEDLDVYVRRLGLRVDGDDCEFLRLRGSLRGERRPQGDPWKHFLTCRLVADPAGRAAYESAVREANVVFDRVEDACPNLFHPRRPPTTEYRFLARTYHMGSELQLFVDAGRVKYYWMHGGDPIDVGELADWLRAPGRFDCSRKSAPPFGGLLQ